MPDILYVNHYNSVKTKTFLNNHEPDLKNKIL